MAEETARALKLSTFIRDTLVEIVKGVDLARAAVRQTGSTAEICPTGLAFAPGKPPAPYKPGRGFVQEVEFDVAVTVTETKSAEGSATGALSIGVPPLKWLGGFDVGGDFKKVAEKGSSEISHITFKVPILLPSEIHPATRKVVITEE